MKTVVVGGGLAGLSAAYELKRLGHESLVLEAADRPGGWARTSAYQNALLEHGPNSFRGAAPNLNRLIDELGLESELVSPNGAEKRIIFHRGRRWLLPRSLFALITSNLLSIRGRLRILLEPFIRSKSSVDETVFDFFRRRIGKEAAELLASTFIRGIHATDAKIIGVADAFPNLVKMESQYGSLFRGFRRGSRPSRRGVFAPRKGMGVICETLANRLDVRLNHRVDGIKRSVDGWALNGSFGEIKAHRVILALPAHQSARLLSPIDELTAGLLSDVEHSHVVVVHEGGVTPQSAPEGFGLLTSPHTDSDTLGIIYTGSLFPDRLVSKDAWQMSSILRWNGEKKSSFDWFSQAMNNRCQLTGFVVSSDWHRVDMCHNAIPKLRPGHLQQMQSAQIRLGKEGDIALAGSYMRGVSVEHAVLSGIDAVSLLLGKGL